MASSTVDLVLLNVAVVTGQLAGPTGVDLFAGGAWIAGVLSAALLLIGGLRLRRLDRVVVVLLAWGAGLAALYVVLRSLSAAGSPPGPTTVGMIPRLVAALLCLGLVLVLRRMPAGRSAAPAAEA